MMCYIRKAKDNGQYPKEGCTLSISNAITGGKNDRGDTNPNPIPKLNSGSRRTQKSGSSRACRQFGPSEAKEGLGTASYSLFENLALLVAIFVHLINCRHS